MSFVILVAFLASVWAVAAILIDSRVPSLRWPAAILFCVGIILSWLLLHPWWKGLLITAVGFAVVLAWWLSLKPSNNRDWQPDNAQTASIQVDGDNVFIVNFRDCIYRTEEDYNCHWELRQYKLSNLRGLDLFITWWGSPWIAHPIVSFDFGDEGHVAMSIETRDVVGQTYSALLGFFRQYTLTYIVAPETDLIKLRTNYRKHEEVYLFHIRATPEQARGLFLEYADRVNALHRKPEWYNALTNNCTTNIAVSAAESQDKRPRWNWRILLNGKADEMLYQRGRLATDGLSLPELKERAHINAAAQAADDSPNFSELIRKGRPGFATQ